MRTGLDIVELAKKIKANQAAKEDFIAETSKVTMQVENRVATLELPTPVKSEAGTSVTKLRTFPVNEIAHNQIAARLNIPVKYYDRMRSEAPDLLATNVNAWFRKNPEKRMIRAMAGNVRAFLSNKYNRIENEEIAEVVLPILYQIPDMKIVSAEVTERRLYIQALSPRLEGEVKKGDVVQAGVTITNSEVGHGAVGVYPLVYRLICLNGMIANDAKLRANHVGGRIEETEDLYADDTRAADDRAILLKVRDHVSAAVDEVRFRARVEKMRGLTEVKLSASDVGPAVEVLAKKIGANETEKGGILASLIESGDLSAWGVLNAVTHQAHRAADYDRSVELERFGGQLLELPRSGWREILEPVARAA